MLFHFSDDFFRNLTPVERIRAIVGDRLQRIGKIRLHEALARPVRFATRLVKITAGRLETAQALLP
jgi:hypothetical protein